MCDNGVDLQYELSAEFYQKSADNAIRNYYILLKKLPSSFLFFRQQ